MKTVPVSWYCLLILSPFFLNLSHYQSVFSSFLLDYLFAYHTIHPLLLFSLVQISFFVFLSCPFFLIYPSNYLSAFLFTYLSIYLVNQYHFNIYFNSVNYHFFTSMDITQNTVFKFYYCALCPSISLLPASASVPVPTNSVPQPRTLQPLYQAFYLLFLGVIGYF